MAEIAILASGNGSNFEAIAERFEQEAAHAIACLIYDRKAAHVRERAARRGIAAYYVGYHNRPREEAERDIDMLLQDKRIDLIVLAGFMRLFTPAFLNNWRGKVINIHPSLLPKYPGTHGIAESYASGDNELGITIHYVDEGMDTGPVIRQERFRRVGTETLEEIESRIHALEQASYPDVILEILNQLEK